MANPQPLLQKALRRFEGGRLDEVVDLCRKALRVAPRHPDALTLLAAALQKQNRASEAEPLFQQVTILQPRLARSWNNLANCQAEQGKREAAVESYRRALAVQPAYPMARKNLAQTLRELGRPTEAVQEYRGAIALQPNFPEALLGLGVTFCALGQHREAVAAFRQAITARPDFAEAHNNLGNALKELGALDEAVSAYAQAIELRPDFAEAHSNLGAALRDKGQIEKALDHCRRAVALDPQHAGAHTNLGLLLWEHGERRVGIEHLRRAAELAPLSAEALNALGGATKDLGNLEEAIGLYRETLRLKPEFSSAHSNLIFCLDLMPNISFQEQQAERRRWWESHGTQLVVANQSYRNTADPGRRLRIGYVSADFKRHSAAFCFGPVLRSHDREQFEIVCYSGVAVEDDLTAAFRDLAARWRPIVGISDQALADQVRADEIDILVDLSGHTGGNRLLTFARKPAPIQVTAWGYATGTGLPTIDYFFADKVMVPAQARDALAEKIYDLPCVITMEPPTDGPDVAPLPALRRGGITFGCFNRLGKVTPQTLALWTHILESVPGSRLVMKDSALSEDAGRSYVKNTFAKRGLDLRRIELRGGTPRSEHLQAFHDIDIALDPFPHNGGISTYEALWMGVPVITLQGDGPAARLTAAILSAVGLPEWITDKEEGYAQLAVNRAHDLEGLARLRGGLRNQVMTSPAGDLAAYTRAVETAYRAMWRKWCERA